MRDPPQREQGNMKSNINKPKKKQKEQVHINRKRTKHT